MHSICAFINSKGSNTLRRDSLIAQWGESKRMYDDYIREVRIYRFESMKRSIDGL